MREFELSKYLRASRKLDLAGIDFEAVPRYPLSREEIRCLTYMMDIETELEERQRWVVATRQEYMWVRRVTFTLPVLNAARFTLMLATGRDKARAIADVLSGSTSPAARVLSAHLLVDEAAAGRLDDPPPRRRKPTTEELFDLSTEADPT